MIPQRKKTPEEIAKLREELGLSGPVTPGAPAPAPPAAQPTPPQAVPSPPAPASAPVAAPVSPLQPQPQLTAVPVPAAPSPEISSPPPPSEPKPVRSLRRSERIPPTNPQPAVHNPNSNLPSKRHSDDELNRIRRVQSIQAQTQPTGTFVVALTAHPLLIGLGYFCIIASIILPIVDRLWTSIPFYIPAIFCVTALITAGFIFLKKKLSLHHAGFIAVTAFFILIFGALYYFPHLRNAP